jgi:hypothetical protein
MEDKKLEKIISLIKEMMVVGTGGFSGQADPAGPVAGRDPKLTLDKRTKRTKRAKNIYRR